MTVGELGALLTMVTLPENEPTAFGKKKMPKVLWPPAGTLVGGPSEANPT